MSGETLRALSRSYAAGDLDRESYKQQRTDLLNRVVSGDLIAERFIMPEPEAPTLFPYDDDDGDTTQEIIPNNAGDASEANANQGRSGGTRKVVMAVAVFALAAVALYVWFEQQTRTPEPMLAEEPAGPASPATEPAAPEKVPDLFASFLASSQWDVDSLDGLAADFSVLSADLQRELRTGDSAVALTDAFVQQISAESALIGLGDAAGALSKQERLLDTMDTLGISTPRLTRAREEWRSQIDSLGETAADTVAVAGTAAPEDEPVPTRPEQAAPTESQTASETAAATQPAEAPTIAPEKPAVSATENEAEANVAVTEQTATEPAIEPEAPPPAAPKSEPAPAPASVTSKATSPASEAKPKAGQMRTNCKASLAQTRRPYCIDILDSGLKGPVLVVLPRGGFKMGGTRASEKPHLDISFDQTIALGLFEVSAGELKRFCAATERVCPRQPWDDDDLPAVNVSWDLAHEYTRWLSSITRAEYRLPSEAEWEYAARGGTTTTYPFGDELLPTHAHFSFRNPHSKPLAANDRSLNRNDFRLYHIVGNVREWVLDGWTENYRNAPANGSAKAGNDHSVKVIRGGSYADGDDALRTAARTSQAAATGDKFTGFRVVRVITE